MGKIRPGELNRLNFAFNTAHNNIFLWRKNMFKVHVICVLLALRVCLEEG
jgi:hypothetical protein